MKFKKIFVVIIMMMTILSMSFVTVFADHTQIYNLSDEEIYERVWNSNFDEYTISQNPAYASMMYYQLGIFLESYTAKTLDVDIADVSNEFFEWWAEQYDGENIEWEETENGYTEYHINTNEKYYWTYDEITDSYVCTDTNNKIIKSYPKYHYKEETNSSVTDNSSTVDKPTTSTSQSSVIEDSPVSPDYPISDEPAYPEETNSTNNRMTSTQITILIIIGVLILSGVIVIIVMLIKKKSQ